MKSIIIFAGLLVIAFAKPVEYNDSTEAADEVVEELAPCANIPAAIVKPSEPEPEVATLPTVGERGSEIQELPAVPETPAPTVVVESNEVPTYAPVFIERTGDSEESVAPETPAPTAAEEFIATTDAPAVVERLGEQPDAETPAPTESSEELGPTTSAPFVGERSGDEASVAPETSAPALVAEELPIAPETAVPEVFSSEAPVEETPAPALRTPEVVEEPAAVSEPEVVSIVVVPEVSAELEVPKPEEPKQEPAAVSEPEVVSNVVVPEVSAELEVPKPEGPNPEEPKPVELEVVEPEALRPAKSKKLTRVMTFTFFDRSSKATSLRHFLEYMRSLKK